MSNLYTVRFAGQPRCLAADEECVCLHLVVQGVDSCAREPAGGKQPEPLSLSMQRTGIKVMYDSTMQHATYLAVLDVHLGRLISRQESQQVVELPLLDVGWESRLQIQWLP